MQHQLVQTDLKFSTALERMSEENEKFKREIRAEVQCSGSTITKSSDLSSLRTHVLGSFIKFSISNGTTGAKYFD